MFLDASWPFGATWDGVFDSDMNFFVRDGIALGTTIWVTPMACKRACGGRRHGCSYIALRIISTRLEARSTSCFSKPCATSFHVKRVARTTANSYRANEGRRMLCVLRCFVRATPLRTGGFAFTREFRRICTKRVRSVANPVVDLYPKPCVRTEPCDDVTNRTARPRVNPTKAGVVGRAKGVGNKRTFAWVRGRPRNKPSTFLSSPRTRFIQDFPPDWFVTYRAYRNRPCPCERSPWRPTTVRSRKLARADFRASDVTWA